ncbi:hypothetical protein Zmor_027248 [Zophobas morio]|uniref:Uncharacterized protein n=1 Tax=Zophobas morio TaxID=2755281 RepID=A0AA38M1U5_9CUCU|nr:hypothetical protein Zmor_027248 [Zophobas morio]
MKYYYFLAVILINGVQATSNELDQKMTKCVSECVRQTNISDDSVDKVLSPEPTNDPTLKAYVLCVLKKIDIIGENGDFKKENLRTILRENGLSAENAESLVNKCAVQKNQPEETAYEGFRCFSQNEGSLL